MFKSKYDFQSSSEAATILQGMLPEVRGLFEQVEILVWLLLTVPASSAEAERSFSGLRRLKTWLRSTMTQSRLNSVAVCHIHKDKLDKLNRRQIAQQFIAANERRRITFGCFTWVRSVYCVQCTTDIIYVVVRPWLTCDTTMSGGTQYCFPGKWNAPCSPC